MQSEFVSRILNFLENLSCNRVQATIDGKSLEMSSISDGSIHQTPPVTFPKPRLNPNHEFSEQEEIPFVYNFSTVVRSERTDRSCLDRGKLDLALWQAAENDQPEICTVLLSHQSSVDINFQGPRNMAPLHIASLYGYLQVCKILVEGKDINIDIKDEINKTPLHLACQSNSLEVAQLLVSNGAALNPVDKHGNTPLHYAIEGGNSELVNWLLEKGCRTSIKNNQRKLPYEMADIPIHIGKPTGFEIIKQIGQGSFGTVFAVRERSKDKLYAMKVLKKKNLIDRNILKYAITERNVLSFIVHPFIVSLHMAFQTRNKLILILEYCQGGTLESLILKHKKLSEEIARLYISEILLALEELHRHEIIYRDLKPENVVLDSDGHAKLIDFGISKQGIGSNSSFCGSLAYLVPEIFNGEEHSSAVDWYQLGILLYELLTGSPPYYSINRQELISNMQAGILKIPTRLTAECKDLLLGLLQKNPNNRLGSSSEVRLHPWFSQVDWHLTYNKGLAMPKPKIKQLQRTGKTATFSETDGTNRVEGWSFNHK